ncbi:hypothetical protein BDB01DRAFT_718628 [Pilobolus umbonatus]|nr:hypothetical protein BDB01DRAFT_718628 [Pilobolus umbonatus]
MQTAVPNPTAPIISGSNDNNSLNALPTSASFGNSIYAASATFLTPTSSKSVAPLYRIDNRENITFVWEFTNMRVRPEMLTLAAVGPNKITYTIATLAGVATSAVWQVKDVPSASPLMMGFYQIQLYDQRGPDAPYQPGWLSPVSRLNIAFYQPETYQPGSGPDYCPLCFYSASKRFSESLGSFGIAVGVALLTSVLIVCGLMY